MTRNEIKAIRDKLHKEIDELNSININELQKKDRQKGFDINKLKNDKKAKYNFYNNLLKNYKG